MKLVNASSDAQALDIDFSGVRLEGQGQVTALSAPDTQATNTIEHPDAIVPVESTLAVRGDRLHYSVPGDSIQVLQLQWR